MNLFEFSGYRIRSMNDKLMIGVPQTMPIFKGISFSIYKQRGREQARSQHSGNRPTSCLGKISRFNAFKTSGI